MDKTVIKLFTGVGRFRVGLDHYGLPVVETNKNYFIHKAKFLL